MSGGRRGRFDTLPRVTLGIFETKIVTRYSKRWTSTI